MLGACACLLFFLCGGIPLLHKTLKADGTGFEFDIFFVLK